MKRPTSEMTHLAVVPDIRQELAPDTSWDADALFDWLDNAVPTLVAAERRTDEARVHVGYVLWLLAQQASPEVYSNRLQALADTHEVTVRTLHRWREQAELVHQLEPGRRSIGQRRRRQRELPDGDSAMEVIPPAEPINEPLRLFDPDNPEELRELSVVVLDVGANRWAEVLTVAEVDSMIGVLRAARSAKLRAAKAMKNADHVHSYQQQKSPALGVVYVCACGDRALSK